MSLVFALDRTRQKDDFSKKGETAERYGVTGYPTYILIDRSGKIAFRSDDPAIFPSFQATVKELGFEASKITEEQASRVIERFLDMTLEKAVRLQ